MFMYQSNVYFVNWQWVKYSYYIIVVNVNWQWGEMVKN